MKLTVFTLPLAYTGCRMRRFAVLSADRELFVLCV